MFWMRHLVSQLTLLLFSPDVGRFEATIARLGRTATYEELSQKKDSG